MGIKMRNFTLIFGAVALMMTMSGCQTKNSGSAKSDEYLVGEMVNLVGVGEHYSPDTRYIIKTAGKTQGVVNYYRIHEYAGQLCVSFINTDFDPAIACNSFSISVDK
jgi:hypothetical protein